MRARNQYAASANAGTITVTIPADVKGRYRLAVIAAELEVLGWDDLTVIPTRG